MWDEVSLKSAICQSPTRETAPEVWAHLFRANAAANIAYEAQKQGKDPKTALKDSFDSTSDNMADLYALMGREDRPKDVAEMVTKAYFPDQEKPDSGTSPTSRLSTS